MGIFFGMIMSDLQLSKTWFSFTLEGNPQDPYIYKVVISLEPTRVYNVFAMLLRFNFFYIISSICLNPFHISKNKILFKFG
jgi:hypothetical protein